MSEIVKVILAAVIIVLSSRLAQNSPLMGAILISLPISSILALSFLYYDTKDVNIVAATSTSILWMLVPSLAFFPLLSFSLKQGFKFWQSLLMACIAMSVLYYIYTWILRYFGYK